MEHRIRGELRSRVAIFAQFNRLPETARFYSLLSLLVAVLAVASGFAVGQADRLPPPLMNPRTPIFHELSPWGRVLTETDPGYLRPPFEVLGVVTPIPGDAASYDYVASPGEGLEEIAAREGIDLDLLAGANSASYARVPRHKTDVKLPLLYSRERTWDRSMEFLYGIAREAPIGGNGTAKKGAPTIARHIVTSGECLWNIAQKYHVRIETIVSMNDLPSARYLRPGQILEIPDTDGTYVTVKRGDTVAGLCKKYDVEITDLVNANPGVNVATLQIGTRLFVPGSGALEQLFRMLWPVSGRISARYGYRVHPVYRRRMMHTGIDIAAGSGSPIHAALEGRVSYVGWKGGYGRTVIIEHPNGYETLYGHCSKILCKRGQTVKRGEIIAKVGRTGIATGPHVHFEVKKNGKRINPEKVLY
jgi:murein DD-endopeptidase MepM/ murein hydrolase activator NlpD